MLLFTCDYAIFYAPVMLNYARNYAPNYAKLSNGLLELGRKEEDREGEDADSSGGER